MDLLSIEFLALDWTMHIKYGNLHANCMLGMKRKSTLRQNCWEFMYFFLPLHQQTPLHIAAREGYSITVKLLLDNGAKHIEDRCRVSETTFHSDSRYWIECYLATNIKVVYLAFIHT